MDLSQNNNGQKQDIDYGSMMLAKNMKHFLTEANRVAEKEWGIPNAFNIERGVQTALNRKALTGASAATGQGLLMRSYDLQIKGTANMGGAMQASGAKIVETAGDTYRFQFRHRSAIHTFSDKVMGTNTTNDSVGTFGERTITLAFFDLRFPIQLNVLQGYLGREQELYDFFINDIENQILGLQDDLGVRAFLDISTISGTAPGANIIANTALLSGQFPLTKTIVKMVNQIRKATGRAAVHVSAAGLTALLTEQDTTGALGQAVDTRVPSEFKLVLANNSLIQAGYVGTLSGAPVFINNAIGDDYTAAANPITAVGGGTKSACFVFNPDMLCIARGKNDLTGTMIFNDDRQKFMSGVVEILNNTSMGAAFVNPNAGTYCTFAP